MRKSLLILPLIAGALLLGACSGDDAQDSNDQSETTTPTTDNAMESKEGKPGRSMKKAATKPERKGIGITTGESQFGEILFDRDDRAIYLFDKEKTKNSECYGACAAAWPPVLTEGRPQASGSVRAGLLGTTRRNDGKTQVTYDGRPLYYYVDEPPGQVLCHNVDEFGGLWLVVKPNGDPVS